MRFLLKATKATQKTEFIGARIDENLKKRFEHACLLANTSISQGLQQLIVQFLKECEQKCNKDG